MMKNETEKHTCTTDDGIVQPCKACMQIYADICTDIVFLQALDNHFSYAARAFTELLEARGIHSRYQQSAHYIDASLGTVIAGFRALGLSRSQAIGMVQKMWDMLDQPPEDSPS